MENGANIHALDDQTLKNAVEYGHLEIVKYLVENGANIHANDDAALRYAKIYSRLEIAKYLNSKINASYYTK